MEKEMLLLQLLSNICTDVLCISAITSVEVPMLTKMRKTDYDKLVSLRYKGISKDKKEKLNIEINDKYNIKELVSKLEKYTSSKNLKNVNNNIKNLKLNRKSLLYLVGWKGAYNAKNNEIKFSNKDAISHEFLHMSSAFYDEKDGVIYDGFLVSNKKDGKVGIGLNEGYTELLASRIYRNGKAKAYPKEVKIASIIEQFFYNTKDMEDYYFNHDLPGFMFYMSQYASHDEIKGLIKDIDSITNTNLLLSQSPTYYYLKVLNRLNKMSDSNNLEPTRKEKIKSMINSNLIMKTIFKSNEINNNILIKK